jgi:hypothetical protein
MLCEKKPSVLLQPYKLRMTNLDAQEEFAAEFMDVDGERGKKCLQHLKYLRTHVFTDKILVRYERPTPSTNMFYVQLKLKPGRGISGKGETMYEAIESAKQQFDVIQPHYDEE